MLISYLAANAIVLPISGWLAEVIGRKRYFLLSLIVFTLGSLLCGLAPSLSMLLLFRALQGVGGGGLQPMAQAILNDSFPSEKRGLAFALYGITAVLATTIGPMLGGWITDNYSWRWIFFIKIPVAAVALYFTYKLVEYPPFLRRLKRGGINVDYIGIAMLSLGVGSLQILLDKGQEDDWFGSHFIVTPFVTAAMCLTVLVIWEWFRKEPIIIEREFGCGGSEIAAKVAELLGWKLWDHELTQEIARLTNSTPQVIEQREWKNDPSVYRVFKSFLRGAFEGALPPTDRLELLDARRIATVSEPVVNHALTGGPYEIVGRGSQYFLRNRKDVFRAFLYASRTSKIHRLITAGITRYKAITDVDTIDRDRPAFVKRYLKLNWPACHRYNAMFNTERGDSFVADMLVRCIQ